MRIVIQRVNHASVTVEGETVGAIGKGLMVLVGAQEGDTAERRDVPGGENRRNARCFEDEQEKMNLSVKDVGGGVSLVSQFTLLGDARHGRRPSFSHAARPEDAEPLVDQMKEALVQMGVPTETGRFRTHMKVLLENDGPVTILLDSKRLF